MNDEGAIINYNDFSLLNLLQLTNSALPVGAYSYSEGLENLIETGIINNAEILKIWLDRELQFGAIRLEAWLMLQGYKTSKIRDMAALNYWNNWASAARETEELREQSWQMGRALARLLQELQPELKFIFSQIDRNCNYAIAFGIAASHWQINDKIAVMGYLHSWATNLIGAGVKLIPIGQTAGQKLLLDLHPCLVETSMEIFNLNADNIGSCAWGLSLASMAHETQYTRLFRS